MVKKMTDEQQEFLNAEGKVVIKACPGSGRLILLRINYCHMWITGRIITVVLQYCHLQM